MDSHGTGCPGCRSHAALPLAPRHACPCVLRPGQPVAGPPARGWLAPSPHLLHGGNLGIQKSVVQAAQLLNDTHPTLSPQFFQPLRPGCVPGRSTDNCLGRLSPRTQYAGQKFWFLGNSVTRHYAFAMANWLKGHTQGFPSLSHHQRHPVEHKHFISLYHPGCLPSVNESAKQPDWAFWFACLRRVI